MLAMTLWILAGIAIAAGYFAERVQRALELAQQSQQNTQALVEIANTRAEILFRLGTTPLSLYGLGTAPSGSILLDGRPYRGEGGGIVRLQDNRGLLNLNIVSDERLNRLLGTLDIPAAQRSAMIDALHDYTDNDNLRRLNGAEEPEYLASGLPPPRNEKLITPYEPRNVIGWRDRPQLWQDNRLPSLTTTSTSVALNPNTAPWQVLATLPGATAESAQAIIVRRQLEPFSSADQLAALLGVPSEQLLFQIITLPADSIRVTQSASGLPWALQYNVSLTPMSARAPWRIDYFYKIGVSYKDDKFEEIPFLPPRAALPATLPSPFLSAP